LLIKYEEILALCASTLNLLLIIVSLESQIKELTERSILFESCLIQSNRSSRSLRQKSVCQKEAKIQE
jgi:hypothetical protein